MRITIKKMEVTVPSGTQQLQGMRTARIFQRELERIVERTVVRPERSTKTEARK